MVQEKSFDMPSCLLFNAAQMLRSFPPPVSSHFTQNQHPAKKKEEILLEKKVESTKQSLFPKLRL